MVLLIPLASSDCRLLLLSAWDLFESNVSPFGFCIVLPFYVSPVLHYHCFEARTIFTQWRMIFTYLFFLVVTIEDGAVYRSCVHLPERRIHWVRDCLCTESIFVSFYSHYVSGRTGYTCSIWWGLSSHPHYRFPTPSSVYFEECFSKSMNLLESSYCSYLFWFYIWILVWYHLHLD